jgi:hypothetical protein
MSSISSFDFSDDLSCICSRIVVGLDTVRIGFEPPYDSWQKASRLKEHAYRWFSQRHEWWKIDKATGLRKFHGGPKSFIQGWFGMEVSLPRLCNGNNSSLDCDVAAAFDGLSAEVDADLSYRRWDGSPWTPPSWQDWSVNRVDITCDVTFVDPAYTTVVIDGFRGAKVQRWTHFLEHAHGVKFMSKAKRVSISVYDKFEKTRRDVEDGVAEASQLDEDRGKLRFTFCINDKGNKTHLDRYEMRSVSGLENQHEWVHAIHDQLMKVRPQESVDVLVTAVDSMIEEHGITWTTN